MENQKRLMPTFNKNKRPRQALLPHPNNVNSRNANFQQNGPASSVSAYQPKLPRSSQNSQMSSRVQPMRNNNNNNNIPQSPWNSHPIDNARAFCPPHSQGSSSALPPPNPWDSSRSSAPPPINQGYGGPYPSTTAPPAPAPAAGARSINDSWQRWAGVQGPVPTTQTRAPVGFTPQAATRWPGTSPSCQPRTPRGAPSWPQEGGLHPNGPPTQNHARPHAQTLQMSRSAKKMQARFSVDDRSLKVATASFDDVRNWSQHTDKIGNLVCEVFGSLSSAISSDVGGVAKMFTLKDEDQMLKCIFYETDRALPRLDRDHWLRCVGSLDRRSGLFRCVSVRPAGQAEQRVRKALIAAGGDSMRERLAAVQEP